MNTFPHYLYHREARCWRCGGSLLDLSPTRHPPGAGHFRGHCFNCNLDTHYDCAEGTVEAIQRNEHLVLRSVMAEPSAPETANATPSEDTQPLTERETAWAQSLVTAAGADGLLRYALHQRRLPMSLAEWQDRPHLLRRFVRALHMEATS